MRKERRRFQNPGYLSERKEKCLWVQLVMNEREREREFLMEMMSGAWMGPLRARFLVLLCFVFGFEKQKCGDFVRISF